MGMSILLLRFGRQALQRTRAVMDTPVLPEPAASKAVPEHADIAFESVNFTYEGAPQPALRNCSVTIPERTLTAIVGPSGSGKSTLVHLIPRLWDVDEGTVRIGGVDVRDLSGADLHARVAMVFQDVVLFSGTIRENILVGRRDAGEEEMIAAAQRAQAHDFIAALPDGYDTVLGEDGCTLSGGERQRVSIARALLKDAPIVLLDEATASVDPAAEAEIQRAIDELVRGKTVVVIAHRLRTIQRAGQIIVLKEGAVDDTGTHAELLERRGLYHRLWSLQSASDSLTP